MEPTVKRERMTTKDENSLQKKENSATGVKTNTKKEQKKEEGKYGLWDAPRSGTSLARRVNSICQSVNTNEGRNIKSSKACIRCLHLHGPLLLANSKLIIMEEWAP